MSEMIDRVAKAIFETWAEAEGSETTWDALVQMQSMDGYANSKKHYKMAFDEARAAIEAMREPSADLLRAAKLAEYEHFAKPGESMTTTNAQTIKLHYNAMIDEAMK